MKRRISPAIGVATSQAGDPEAVTLEGRRLTVSEILERWQETGKWWEGESPRTYYRVWTSEGRVLELCREEAEWTLSRILG